MPGLGVKGVVPLKQIEYGLGYTMTPIYPIFYLLKGDYGLGVLWLGA